MTEAQALELIEEQFASAWPTASGSVGFALLNEAATPAPSGFAALSWRHTRSAQITQGVPSRKERRGIVMVKVWAPANGGGALLATLCDAARTVFECQQLPLTGDEPVTLEAGLSGEVVIDGNWAMTMVSFPFRYYLQS
jgi:hypothetical protein